MYILLKENGFPFSLTTIHINYSNFIRRIKSYLLVRLENYQNTKAQSIRDSCPQEIKMNPN